MKAPESLARAAKENDIVTLRRLLFVGHDINERDNRGYSPLMLAAYSDQKAAVDFLLRAGADPNSCDYAGNSVLMGTAFKGHLEIVDLLLAAGADPQAKNYSGMDAYDFATTFGRSHVAKRILEKQGKHERPTHRWRNFCRLLFSRFQTRTNQR